MEDLLLWIEGHLFAREHLVHLLVATSSPKALAQWLEREGGAKAPAQAPVALHHTPASQKWFERCIGQLVARDVAPLISLLRWWGASSPIPPVLREIRALRSDRLLKKRTDIVRRFAPDLVVLALMCEERREALEWIRQTMVLAPGEEATLVRALHDALPSQDPLAPHVDKEETACSTEEEGAKKQEGPGAPWPDSSQGIPQPSADAQPHGSWVDQETLSLSLSLEPGFFDFALTYTGAKALWEWLQAPHQAPLRAAMERDVGTHIPALSRPLLHTLPVRRRLLHHLTGLQEQHPSLGTHLLWVWKHQRPVPTVLQELCALGQAHALEAQLPQLHARHGGFALTSALFVEMRRFTHIEWLHLLAQARSLDDAWALSLAQKKPKRSGAPPSQGFDIEVRRLEAQNEDGASSSVRDEMESLVAQMRDAHARRLAATQQRVAELDEQLKGQSALREQREKQARDLQEQLEREARLREQQEAALSAARHQVQQLRTAQEEEAKRRDRAQRRALALEAQLETEHLLHKRLRRQLRQTQSVLSFWRLLATDAGAPETPSAPLPQLSPLATPPDAAPTSARPVDPWNQVWQWQEGQHVLRLAPRELRRLVRRGDEKRVMEVARAWRAHEQRDPHEHREWKTQLESLDPLWGPYLARVLEEETPRVLVDASNVARFRPDQNGRGRLGDLVAVLDELRRLGAFPLGAIADASLPYNIDDRAGLWRLVETGEVEVTPSGTEADEWLTRTARDTGAFVVTGDRSFHKKVAPNFEPLRVGFSFDEEGRLHLDEF